jgi:hypothetical protein
VRAVFDTAAGDMRGATRPQAGSKTMADVLDHFATSPARASATKETFHSAVRAYVNKSLVELHRLLGRHGERPRQDEADRQPGAQPERHQAGHADPRRGRRHPQDARRAR